MNPELVPPISENYLKIFGVSDWLFVPLSVLFSLIILRVFSKKLITDLPNGIYHYYLGFLLRVLLCGFAMYLFQFHFKAGDIFHYQKAAKVLTDLAVDKPSDYFKILTHFNKIKDIELTQKLEQPTSKIYIQSVPTGIIVRISSLLMIFFGSSTFAVGIIFCLFSYLGIWLLYRYFSLRYIQIESRIRYTILYFPSILFWSSNGIGKETIVFGALSLCMILLLKKMDGHKLKNYEYLILFLSIVLIFFVKIYIWLCVLIGLIVWRIFYQINIQKDISFIKKSMKIMQTLVLGIFLIVSNYFINVKLKKANEVGMVRIINNISTYNQELTGGSAYFIEKFNSNIIEDIKILAISVFTSIYRPFFWEAKNLFTLFYALESFFLIFFTVWSLKKLSIIHINERPEIVFLLIFSLSVFTIAGYSAQNFGTLSRYRSIPLSYFLLSGILMLNFIKPKN